MNNETNRLKADESKKTRGTYYDAGRRAGGQKHVVQRVSGKYVPFAGEGRSGFSAA